MILIQYNPESDTYCPKPVSKCQLLVELRGFGRRWSTSEWEYEQFFQTQQDIFLKKPWRL